MNKIFSYHFIGYLILIISILLINIALKYGDDTNYYRYFIKPIAPGLILHYFLKNNQNYKRQKSILVVSGILLFVIGDFLFLDRYTFFSFNMAIASLVLAKICFIACFLNHEDFNFKRIFPFLFFFSVYMLLILTAIINNLKDIYFVQVLVYLFVTLLFGLFSYLRYRAVNKASFILVLIGFLMMLVADGVTALNMFSPKFQYNLVSSTVITLTFNLSLFCIIVGLLAEDLETTEYK